MALLVSQYMVFLRDPWLNVRRSWEGFWRTYVCSGARTNIAHELPTNKVIEKGALVMIDLHPIVNNYSADICGANCGLYTGPWGVRVEDTVVVGKGGPVVLTDHPRRLTA